MWTTFCTKCNEPVGTCLDDKVMPQSRGADGASVKRALMTLTKSVPATVVDCVTLWVFNMNIIYFRGLFRFITSWVLFVEPWQSRIATPGTKVIFWDNEVQQGKKHEHSEDEMGGKQASGVFRWSKPPFLAVKLKVNEPEWFLISQKCAHTYNDLVNAGGSLGNFTAHLHSYSFCGWDWCINRGSPSFWGRF